MTDMTESSDPIGPDAQAGQDYLDQDNTASLREQFTALNQEHARNCEQDGVSVKHYFHPQWILDNYPEPDEWKKALEEFVQLPHVTTTMLTDYLADFAWCARSKKISIVTLISPEFIDNQVTDRLRFTYLYLALSFSRFNFNVEALADLLNAGRGEFLDSKIKNLGQAFHLFTQLYRGNDVAEKDIEAFTANTENLRALNIVLQGMYLCPNGGYGQQMLETARKFLDKNTDDPQVWMRLGIGYKRINDWDTGRDRLEKAMRLLRSDQIDIHTQYAFERELMLYEKHQHDTVEQAQLAMNERVEETIRKVEAASAQQAEQFHKLIAEANEQMRQSSHEMLFRIMEILGLFLAVVGLLASVIGVSLAGDLTMWERITVIASASIFMIFFFIMIRVLAKPKERPLVLETITVPRNTQE